MPDRKMTAAIYARVSTKDKGQDPENQLMQLRDYCQRQGWPIYKEYVDISTGTTGDRQSLKDLMLAVHQRWFDVLVVWSMDRFSREGILKTMQRLELLRHAGVQFESVTEPQFRTTGPFGELMIAFASFIAHQESERLSERVKAGLDQARIKGRHIGRPRRIFDRDRAKELRAAGLSWRQIAQDLGQTVGTVRDAAIGRYPSVGKP